MSKTKKQTASDKFVHVASQAGFMLMAGLATLGMLDLPNHPEKRIVLPARPVFAFAEDNVGPETANPIRREREEAAPHYVSYSVVQRTAPRSGKH